MRRITTPKRPQSKDKEYHKILPLNNLLSTLLTTTSSDFQAIQGISNGIGGLNSLKLHNLSKYQSPKMKQGLNTYRPQTSQKKHEDLSNYKTDKKQSNTEVDNHNQRLRPKSSTTDVGAYKTVPSKQIHKESNSKQENNFVVRPPATCQVRKYSSLSNQKQIQYKVQYKIVHAENLFQKLIQKPPKTIQSTKSIGLVKGYGVNSHKFYQHGEVCQGRILIIGNLTKVTKQQAITSLYAIFQSTKSVLFIDFIREHFQIEISKRLDHFPPPPITKELIESCLHKIQNKFCQMYNVPIKKNLSITMSITNSFGLSYSMVFVRNDEIIVCTKGQTQAKSSVSFGQKLQGQHSNSLYIRRIGKQEAESLDFIAIISEGMTFHKKQNSSHDNQLNTLKPGDYDQKKNDSAWIQRQIWQILLTHIVNRNQLKNQQNQKMALNIHQLMGLSIDSLYSLLQPSPPSGKNISIVLICMKNIQKLLQTNDNLQLPYTKQNISNLSIPQNEKQLPVGVRQS